jgi:hypothetical protein
MEQDILQRVFDDDDDGNAECNYDLFGDPNDEDSFDSVTIPTEVDLARVNKLFQQKAGKEKESLEKISSLLQRVEEGRISLLRMLEVKEDIWKTRIEHVQSRKTKQRMILPVLKKTFLQNAEAMLAKERLNFDDTTSDENNSIFLSLPCNKILLYLGLECAHDLLQFGLASKSCYKIFRNIILVELGLKRQNKDGEEKVIRIHNFEDIFDGMSIHSIARSFDELVWLDGYGGCERDPYQPITIEKDNQKKGEEKLTVKYDSY